MAIRYVVRAGDCIATIAFQHGFFPDTIWNHQSNASLREQRSSGNVLAVGDVVNVPDREPKTLPRPTGQKHVFRRKGVPEQLAVRFLDWKQQPRGGVAYTLDVDGVTREGTTTSDGWLREPIVPDAKTATITLPEDEVYVLALGGIGPRDSIDGIQQRLRNLGYDCSTDQGGTLGPATRLAIQRCYSDQALEAPATIDTSSLDTIGQQLETLHGC